MPSGSKKRKAAKKKQVSTTNPGDNDSQESNKTLDPLAEVVERKEDSEDISSENKSKEDGNIEIKEGSKSKSSSSSSSDSPDDEDKIVEKKVVVLESAPVIEPVPVIETISPVVGSIKPVDSLVEEVSQVFDENKSEEKKDLVVEETQKETETETPVVLVGSNGSLHNICKIIVPHRLKFFENKSIDMKTVVVFGILNGVSIGFLNLSLGFNSWFLSYDQTCNTLISILV